MQTGGQRLLVVTALSIVVGACASRETSTQPVSQAPVASPATTQPESPQPKAFGTIRELTLFGPEHKTLEGWYVAGEFEFEDHGPVRIEKDSIVLGAGAPATGIRWTGPFPTDNYEVTLDAMRVEGFDFFCGMTFPVADEPCTLILGGWGGGVVGLSNVDSFSAAENETTLNINFKNGRWYRVRLRVTKPRIQVWIDDEEEIDLEREGHSFDIWIQQEAMKPFGIATWYTKAALRNIRVRRVDPES
jgi:hypothetical protein